MVPTTDSEEDLEPVSGTRQRLLVVGETGVAQRVCASLVARDQQVVHLAAPDDRELATVMGAGMDAAAVIIRDDVAALRYALALAHLDASIPLTVSIFDGTLAEQLAVLVPQATVVSPASLAAPSLLGPCLGGGAHAVFVSATTMDSITCHAGESTWVSEPRRSRRGRRRPRPWLRWGYGHHDAGTRLMLVGLLGLLAVLVLDLLWLVVFHHRPVVEAFAEAARVVATVGPAANSHGQAYALFSASAMLLTIVLTALFTAGLVDRLLEPRLLGILGMRTPPRRDHVIVVGMGQVGLRLCELLLEVGIPVVGVERDRDAEHLRLARRMGVPVIVGGGSERRVLEKVGLDRCRALAAVGSNDLDNIAVAVVASAISPNARVVLRAGEHEAIAETRSLLPLGTTRDVTELASSFVVAHLLGHGVDGVIAADDATYIWLSQHRCEPWTMAKPGTCRHVPPGGGTR